MCGARLPPIAGLIFMPVLGVNSAMAYIEKIDPGDAKGPLKEEYDAAIQRAGRVYQILQVQSLNHETLHRSIGLYLATMQGPSGLARAEREMLAAVVSQANDCFY